MPGAKDALPVTLICSSAALCRPGWPGRGQYTHVRRSGSAYHRSWAQVLLPIACGATGW